MVCHPTTASDPAVAATPDGRLASLDALRGLDMFWIIGGSSVAQAAARASGQSWLDYRKGTFIRI